MILICQKISRKYVTEKKVNGERVHFSKVNDER